MCRVAPAGGFKFGAAAAAPSKKAAESDDDDNDDAGAKAPNPALDADE